jgi:hypothetical protein
MVVAAAPGVGIDNVVAADREVTYMSEIIGEDCRTEPGREGDARILIFAFCGGNAMGSRSGGYDQHQHG